MFRTWLLCSVVGYKEIGMGERLPGYERELRDRIMAHENYLVRVAEYLKTGSIGLGEEIEAENRELMEAAAERLECTAAYTITDYLLGRSID